MDEREAEWAMDTGRAVTTVKTGVADTGVIVGHFRSKRGLAFFVVETTDRATGQAIFRIRTAKKLRLAENVA